MTGRSIVSLGLSAGGAAVLLALLLATSHLDLHALMDMVLAIRPTMLLALIALLAINTLLSGEKWRLVDKRLRGQASALPRPLYFALTAFGTMLGSVIPMPLGAAVTRSLGLHFHGGRGLVRGGAATLFEQGYDLLVAAVLTSATAALMILGGGPIKWILLAGGASIIGLLCSGVAAGLVIRIFRRFGSRRAGVPGGRLAGLAASVVNSELLGPTLVRRLFVLSLLRFFNLSLMAGATTAAFGLEVPLWQLSAALPLAMLASALPLTPGGLGVIEWTFVSVLVAFGTRFDAAAEWAVLNRLAVTLAGIAIGIMGAMVGLWVRAPRTTSPSA